MTTTVTFNGEYLIIDDGISTQLIPAISGRVGHQSPSEIGVVNVGPIPEGTYHVRQDEYQSIDNISSFDYIRSTLDPILRVTPRQTGFLTPLECSYKSINIHDSLA